MTLAAGYKFEHPKAQGVSPILLLSDSRYSYRGPAPTHRDNGKKIHALAKNIAAVFAGNVLEAQHALTRVKKSLALSSSGSFEDLRKILKSSFDSEITTWDNQTPHCLLGAISTKGDSKLFYAEPDGKSHSYKVSERLQAVIGIKPLEPKLQEKIDALKPSGLYHPKHFMCRPDDMFPSGYDPRNQAILDAREISGNIARAFLEIVGDPSIVAIKPPLQNILLLPSGPEEIALYEIASSTQITSVVHLTLR
jgi:hypothetical protein